MMSLMQKRFEKSSNKALLSDKFSAERGVAGALRTPATAELSKLKRFVSGAR